MSKKVGNSELRNLIIDKIGIVADGISKISSPQTDLVAATAINRLIDSLNTLNYMEEE